MIFSSGLIMALSTLLVETAGNMKMKMRNMCHKGKEMYLIKRGLAISLWTSSHRCFWIYVCRVEKPWNGRIQESSKLYRQNFNKEKEGPDVDTLISEINQSCYVPDEWRLLIDNSKPSLKAVLLHNANDYV